MTDWIEDNHQRWLNGGDIEGDVSHAMNTVTKLNSSWTHIAYSHSRGSPSPFLALNNVSPPFVVADDSGPP